MTLRKIIQDSNLYVDSTRDIWVRLLSGETLESVANHYDISTSRVGQLFVKIRRLLQTAIVEDKTGIGHKLTPALYQNAMTSAYLIDLRPQAEMLIAVFDDLLAVPEAPQVSIHYPNINPEGGRPAQVCQSCGGHFHSNYHETQLCYMCFRGLVELSAILQSFPEE